MVKIHQQITVIFMDFRSGKFCHFGEILMQPQKTNNDGVSDAYLIPATILESSRYGTKVMPL